ncbi:MAG: MMPL family transporter, partial [Desulfomonilia bacterium]
ILYNALAVAAGFLVLVPSNFVIISQLGILVALVMITTSLASLTLLPAILKVFPPRLAHRTAETTMSVFPARVFPQGVHAGEENVVGYQDNTTDIPTNRRIEHDM